MESETDSSWPFEDEPQPRVSPRLVASPSLPVSSVDNRSSVEPPGQNRYPRLLEPIPGHFGSTDEWAQSFPSHPSHPQAELSGYSVPRPVLSTEADLRASGLVHTTSEILESPRAIVINHYHYHQSPPPQIPGHHQSILGLHFPPGAESPAAPDTPDGDAALLATLQRYRQSSGTDYNRVSRGGYRLVTPETLAEQSSNANQSSSLPSYLPRNNSDSYLEFNQAGYGTVTPNSVGCNQPANPYLPRPHSESSLRLLNPFQTSSDPLLGPANPRLTPPIPPLPCSANSFQTQTQTRSGPSNPLRIPPNPSWNPPNQVTSPVTPSKSQPLTLTKELLTQISLPHPPRSQKRPIAREGGKKRARTESPPRSYPPRHPNRLEQVNPFLNPGANPLRRATSSDLNLAQSSPSQLPASSTGYALTRGFQANQTSQLSSSEQPNNAASWLGSFATDRGSGEQRSEEQPRAPPTFLLQGALERFMAHPPKRD